MQSRSAPLAACPCQPTALTTEISQATRHQQKRGSSLWMGVGQHGDRRTRLHLTSFPATSNEAPLTVLNWCVIETSATR
eukprot:m.221046 g.221046  ORF g.221046 m.221046 type:complete len:79 (-) comp15606_c0_seq6:4914-5150(-)